MIEQVHISEAEVVNEQELLLKIDDIEVWLLQKVDTLLQRVDENFFIEESKKVLDQLITIVAKMNSAMSLQPLPVREQFSHLKWLEQNFIQESLEIAELRYTFDGTKHLGPNHINAKLISAHANYLLGTLRRFAPNYSVAISAIHDALLQITSDSDTTYAVSDTPVVNPAKTGEQQLANIASSNPLQLTSLLEVIDGGVSEMLAQDIDAIGGVHTLDARKAQHETVIYKYVVLTILIILMTFGGQGLKTFIHSAEAVQATDTTHLGTDIFGLTETERMLRLTESEKSELIDRILAALSEQLAIDVKNLSIISIFYAYNGYIEQIDFGENGVRQYRLVRLEVYNENAQPSSLIPVGTIQVNNANFAVLQYAEEE